MSSPFKLGPGVSAILLSTLCFAVANVGVKWLPRIPVLEIVLFRALVTLVLGYLTLRLKGLSPWGHNKPLLLLRGAVGTVALVSYFYTLRHMPLSSAVTIQYLSPIFTILISALLLREPPRPVQWLFFLLAFAGVLLVKGLDAERVSLPELAIGVGSALFSGLAYNIVRKLKDYDHPFVVVFYFPLVTVPAIGPYTALALWVTPSLAELGLLLLVGLATTGGQVFLTLAFQADRAANISIFNYLGIAYAIALGYLFFGEMVLPLEAAGVGLIVGGVLLSTRYRREA